MDRLGNWGEKGRGWKVRKKVRLRGYEMPYVQGKSLKAKREVWCRERPLCVKKKQAVGKKLW